MNCRWNGSENPRVLPGRHDADCPSDGCDGCQPCAEHHCGVCRRVHVEGRTCAECLAETREALADIARMCAALPAEVHHRGTQGEAMMLLGPVPDLEARQHVEASYLAGRLPEGWIETMHGKGCPTLVNEPCLGCAGSEYHPLLVLGTWDAAWRDALEHEEPKGRVTVASSIRYLNRQMTYMADFEHAPFEDFARDVRRCVTHLKSVLCDKDMGDRANIGCFDCKGTLERKLTDHGFEDHWTCARCRRRYTYAEYNFALRAALEPKPAPEDEEASA